MNSFPTSLDEISAGWLLAPLPICADDQVTYSPHSHATLEDFDELVALYEGGG